MATAWMTLRRGNALLRGAVADTTAAAGVRGPGCAGVRCAYQLPICSRTKMAISATPENHAMLDCPWGTTTKAASNGPDATDVSTHLEQGLGQPIPSAGRHPRHAGGLGMEDRGAHPDQRGSEQDRGIRRGP